MDEPVFLHPIAERPKATAAHGGVRVALRQTQEIVRRHEQALRYAVEQVGRENPRLALRFRRYYEKAMEAMEAMEAPE